MADLICDTSPLVALHQIGRLDILQKLSAKVIVPGAVQREIEVGAKISHDVPDLTAIAWIVIESPTTSPPLPNASQLGPGELDVLWLALERPGTVVLLDDQPARRVAAQLGLAYTGTLGALVDAKRLGIVPAVAPLIDDLQRRGFHMSVRLRETILRTAGESP